MQTADVDQFQYIAIATVCQAIHTQQFLPENTTAMKSGCLWIVYRSNLAHPNNHKYPPNVCEFTAFLEILEIFPNYCYVVQIFIQLFLLTCKPVMHKRVNVH